jgi:ferredoxin
LKLAVDLERCTGHGRCYALAPHVFDADDHGHCVLLAVEVPPAHQREARAAVLNCPEDALAITEE